MKRFLGTNWGSLIYYTLFSASLLAFGYLLWLVFNDLNEPIGTKYLREYNEVEKLGLSATLWLNLSPENEIAQYTSFQYDMVSDAHLLADVTEIKIVSQLDKPVCIQRVLFLRSIHFRRMGLNKTEYDFSTGPNLFPTHEFSGLCTEDSLRINNNDTENVLNWTSPIHVPTTYSSPFRRYPLDGVFMDFFVWLEVVPKDGGPVITVAPDVVFSNVLPGWAQTARISQPKMVLDSMPTNSTLVSFDLHRPISQTVLTWSILGLLSVFALAILFVSDAGSAAEVAVAILLGLWGVQEFLIPSNVEGLTLVHFAQYLIYLTLGWATLFRFVLRPIRQGLAHARSKDSQEHPLGPTPSGSVLRTTVDARGSNHRAISPDGDSGPLTGPGESKNRTSNLTFGILLSFLSFLAGVFYYLRRRW